MTGSQQSYWSYLLRLWLSPSGDRMLLRASLENAQTGERIGFGDLENLFTYLRAQTDDGFTAEGDQSDR
jgi:hypothetical protein